MNSVSSNKNDSAAPSADWLRALATWATSKRQHLLAEAEALSVLVAGITELLPDWKPPMVATATMLLSARAPPPQPSASPSGSSTSAANNEASLFHELASREYHPYKSGKPGEWCISDQLSKPLLELLSKGPLEFQGWKYRLTGPKDSPTRFVARNKVGRL